MRNATVFICCLLVFTSAAFCQVNIRGDVSGEWVVEDSPYIVIGNIELPRNETLNIEPGVRVLFQEDCMFTVFGEIIAIGNENDSIYFAWQEANEFWRGIRMFDASDDSRFSFCVFMGATSIGEWRNESARGGALYIRETECEVTHCTFTLNHSSGEGASIHTYECSPLIDSNYFHDNHADLNGAALCLRFSNSIVSNNIITNGTTDWGPGGMIIWNSNPIIEHNIITHNSSQLNWGSGIYIGDACNPIIRYNIIAFNQGGAIYAGRGMNITEFYNNTIAYNAGACAVLLYGGVNMTFTNCIFWENQVEFWVEGSRATVSYSLVQDVDNEDIDQGEGIFENDPGFVDPENNDFNLLPDSPCIDAGDPEFERDVDGSITDIGAMPFVPMGGNPEIIVDPNAIEVEEAGEYVINIANDGDTDLWYRSELAGDWISFDEGRGVVVPDGDVDMFVRIEDNLQPGAFQTTLHIFSNDRDNPHLEIPVRYDNDAGHAPQWHEMPQRVVCTETDTLTLAVRGIDIDQDALTITYESDDLPWGVFFTDRRDGTGVFEWNPGYNDAGAYTARFTLHDEVWHIARDVEIVVNNLNRPPEVLRPIESLEADEDSNPIVLGVIHDVFTDPDPEDRDSLSYGIIPCPGIEAWITENGNLACAPLRNWNGQNCFSIFATDGADSAFNEINVTIHPVNDLPSEFTLLTPENDSTVEFSDTLKLSWETSVDVVEDSTIYYALGLFFSHQSRWFYDIDTPSFSISSDVIQMSDGVPVEVDWQVWAYDGTDSLCCSQPFSFRAVYNLVDENGNTIPTSFALHDPYPNPFNNEVKIHFDLPIAADINLALFDTMGRQVRLIQSGWMSVGIHSISYNADGLTNGVYILRYSTPEGVFTRKLTLLQ